MSSWRDDRSQFVGPPPQWWPQNEPWPPRGSRFYAERRRRRFLRRSGWFSFWPIWGLLFLVGRTLRGRGGVEPSGLVILLLACAAAAGTVAYIIRRIAAPVGDIVSAADRIARRDYRVRVDEPEHAPSWVRDTARAFNAMAKELESQDQARRQLTADIAHELRTPLAVVQGKLEGLIDGVYPRETPQLQGVLDDTRVLARLVDDLRTLSTAESGALALSKEPTDIVSLANDVVTSLAVRTEEAGVTLHLESNANEIEPIALDPLRIREVLMNLVANALRYTPRGGRIDVGVHDQGSGVEIRVIDTGAGISADELPRIFDRFYKGAASSGSGLGLTIAKSLVTAHGGTIRAESRLGAGTTMIVNLPR